jgi:hypothetical protein
MTSVLLQFHAQGGEIIDLARNWADEYGFRLAVEQFFPDYRAVEVDLQSDTAFEKLHQVRRVSLGRGPLDLTASTAHRFVTPDVLYLDIQWPTDQGLREGALGGSTDDDQLLRMWRRMIRQLVKSMHKGASTLGWTGIVGPAPAHKHTAGAHRLAEQGVRMLASAGSTEYLFDDVLLSASETTD